MSSSSKSTVAAATTKLPVREWRGRLQRRVLRRAGPTGSCKFSPPCPDTHRFPANNADAAYDGKRIHKETLSPFDSTEYRGKEIAGQHPPARDSGLLGPGDLHAGSKTERPSPKGETGRHICHQKSADSV